jgi:hypothetical protein
MWPHGLGERCAFPTAFRESRRGLDWEARSLGQSQENQLVENVYGVDSRGHAGKHSRTSAVRLVSLLSPAARIESSSTRVGSPDTAKGPSTVCTAVPKRDWAATVCTYAPYVVLRSFAAPLRASVRLPRPLAASFGVRSHWQSWASPHLMLHPRASDIPVERGCGPCAPRCQLSLSWSFEARLGKLRGQDHFGTSVPFRESWGEPACLLLCGFPMHPSCARSSCNERAA